MSDRIDFGGEPWKAIPRRVLRDERLTLRAKGGLVTLLSHEEGWVRSAIATLMHEANCGRKQAQAVMRELRDTGYADLRQERRGNLVASFYVIYAVPKGEGIQGSFVNSTGRPETVPARSRSTDKGAAVVEALEVEPQEEEPTETPKATPAPIGASVENGNGKEPGLIGRINTEIIGILLDRYPDWEHGKGALTYGGVVKLVNQYGPKPVNYALEELLEQAAGVDRPHPYLLKVAKEFSA